MNYSMLLAVTNGKRQKDKHVKTQTLNDGVNLNTSFTSSMLSLVGSEKQTAPALATDALAQQSTQPGAVYSQSYWHTRRETGAQMQTMTRQH